MRKALNIFEKLALSVRAISDAYSNAISFVSLPKTDCALVLSTFITDELMNMFVSSKNIFFHRHIMLLLDEEITEKKYRLLLFSDAITLIDRCIGNACSDIVSIEAPYNAEKEKLTSLKDCAERKNAIHLVRMYETKLIDLNEKRSLAVDNELKIIERLLNEKIRVLKKALAYQDKVQCKSLLRMQYYYDKVCQFNKKYTVTSLKIKDYYNTVDMSFLERYEDQLAEAKTQLDNIINRKNIKMCK